jgi:HEAT repeat protein
MLRSPQPKPLSPDSKPAGEGATAALKATTAPTQSTSVRPGNAAGAAPRMSTNLAGAGGLAGAKPQVPVNALINALNDASLSSLERRAAIQALARLGTPEAIAALKEALRTGSDDLRAAIADGLGECGTEECTKMLLGLLDDRNEAVAQAAVRGLAQQGTVLAATTLTQLLNDPQRSVDMRIEAALGLGTIEQPGVLETLQNAAKTIPDEDIVTQVLNAIAGRDFTTTKAFFEEYVKSAASSDLRAGAVEALWQAKGDPNEFLARRLSDPDPEMRSSAAWAMSATDATGDAGLQLVYALQGEQDPDVRMRLYQALRNQESFEIDKVMALVQRETDPGARLAGMDLLGATVRDNPTPELQNYFDRTAAPALRDAALKGETNPERMAAVLALVRASTGSALSALQEVAQQAPDQQVKAAAARAVANPLPVVAKPSR